MLAASDVLAAHLLPGFSPHVLRGFLQYSSDAPPVVLQLSWDKALVGLTLLAWWLGKAVPFDSRRFTISQCLGIALVTLLLVPSLALVMELVDW